MQDFVDDMTAKITGFRHCNNSGGLLFKGYQVQFQTSTGIQMQQYGTMDDLAADAMNCFPTDGSFTVIDDDIVNFAIYVDSNDVEGLHFITSGGGDPLIYKANYPVYKPYPPAKLFGRPIGFRVEFGHTASDRFNTPDQPMKVQIIYNSCLCPMSEFLGDTPPQDINVDISNLENPEVQTLAFQQTLMGERYDQDCGTYSVRIEQVRQSPLPDNLISLYSQGGQYIDRLSIRPTTHNQDIGIYQLKMHIEQIGENGDGYFQPVTGFLSPISYDFSITINPCPINEIITDPAQLETIVYSVGDFDLTFGPYSFQQVSNCNYIGDVTVEIPTVLSEFVYHDEQNSSFVISQTFDTSKTGIHDIEVKHTITMPESAENPSKMIKLQSDVLYRIEIQPCKITTISTPVVIDPFDYYIGDEGFTFGKIIFETDSLCEFPISYEITGQPTNLIYSLPNSNFVIQKTSDPMLRGRYEVELTGKIEQSDGLEPETISTYSSSIKFQVTLYPCQVTEYNVIPSTIDPIEYILDQPSFNFGQYIFTQTDDCGYESNVQVMGLPSFVELRQSQQDFFLTKTNSPSDVGSYTTTLSGSIEVPIDWTSQTQTLTSQVEFQIRVYPCQVETYTATFDSIGTVIYLLGGQELTFGSYNFQQQPNCGYEEKIGLTNLPTQFVDHSAEYKKFTIAQTFESSLENDYDIVITSQFDQPDYQGTVKTVFAEIFFTLSVKSCIVQSYEVAQSINGPILYTLGDPNTEFGPYKFFQTPECGYDSTISFQNLPTAFVLHDDSQKQLTIPQTDNSEFVGIYDVILRSEFTQVNLNGGMEVVFENIEFQIIVTPCMVTSFEAISDSIEPIFYVLDDPQQSFGPYKFAQSPNCGYEQNISFQNLPESYIVHDPITKTFTLAQTQDLNFLGIYDVVITSTFQQLQDDRSTIAIQSTIEFEVTVSGCTVNSYEATKSPPELVTYVLGDPSKTFGPYQFVQSPFCEYPETVTFQGLPSESYVTHNEIDKTFTINKNTAADFLGIYDVVIQSQFLQRNIDGSQTPIIKTIQFQISVTPCSVQSYDIIQAPESEIEYTIGGTSFMTSPYLITQNPDCGYDDTISFKNLPDPKFFTHDQATRIFTVKQTDDIAFMGVYDVEIESSFQQLLIDKTTTEVTQTISLTLTVSPCIVTSFEVVSSEIPDVTYTLDEDSFMFASYEFSQTPACGYPINVQTFDFPSEPFIKHDEIGQIFVLSKTSDADYLGIYEVEIQAQFDQLEISGSKTPQTQSIEFKIIVSPCIVVDFDAISQPIGTISYVLGDPQQEFGPYQFSQSPQCNYPQTITFQNLDEQIVNHRLATQDFMIDQTLNQNFLGDYSVVIQSQFDQPQITGPAEVITQKIEFILRITPCQISDFSSPSVIESLTYTLGDPGFTFGNFEFIQRPMCNYAQFHQFSGLPPFVKHQSLTSDFELISTENFEHVKTYSIILMSRISIPDDNQPNPAYSDIQSDLRFQIEVLNPCIDSVIDDFTIPNIVTSVQATKSAIDLSSQIPKDSVSKTKGDKTGLTFCGQRQFRITSSGHEKFLSYNEFNQTLILQSTDDEDVSETQVTIEAFFVDYPEVVTKFTTFTVTVNTCEVLSLQPVSIANQVYEVSKPPLLFKFNEFIQVPACGSKISYEIQISSNDGQSYQPQPEWIGFSQNFRQLTVQTDDFDLIRIFNIRISANTGEIPIQASETFQLQVASTICQLEEISINQEIESIDYLINAQDAIELAPDWQSSETQLNCPFEFTLDVTQTNRDNSRMRRNLQDLSAITFDASDGSFVIQTDNFSYDQVQWTISVTKTSILSNTDAKSAAYSISIDFKDICWESTLIAPQFTENSLSFDLFQAQSFFFNSMDNLSHDQKFCGGFSYELSYISGPLSSSQANSIYQINKVNNEITGIVSLNPWIGDHKIALRGINGVYDSSTNARGQNGFFNSVLSSPVSIKIKNPCLSTVLNPDQSFGLPSVITVPKDETIEVITIWGPKDSVSVMYGDGYDLCGPRSYAIYGEDGSIYNGDSFSIIHDKKDSNGIDLIDLQLYSYQQGPTMTEKVRVEVYLDQYKEQTKIDYQMTLKYRECFASKFEGATIELQRIQVGQPAFAISLPFSQEPCNFEQFFEAFIVDKTTEEEKPLPSFMFLKTTPQKSDSASLQFNLTDTTDQGEYSIKVYSQLQNFFRNTSSIQFKVVVYEQPFYDWTTKPRFDVRLEDQRVAIGDSLVYSPQFGIELNDWSLYLNVNLGRSNKFTDYDQRSKTFTCMSDFIDQVDIGSHKVLIEAKFTKFNMKTIFIKRQFQIIVYEKSIVPDPDVPPSIIKFLPKWEKSLPQELDQDFELETEEVRPVPYISRLTDTGLLTIGWDQIMDPPLEFEQIPQEKVAIGNYSMFTQEDVEERLLFEWYRIQKDNGQLEVIQLALIDALEVRILRDDPESELQPIQFSYSIAGFDSSFLDIQLNIMNPENIAEDFGEPDRLIVTFWDTQYFKSSSATQVKYGQEVEVKILRQINPSEAAQLEQGLVYIKASIIAIVLMVVAFCSAGSLLPLWMFINSLQIVTHTTLLNSMMPGNAHYVFQEYLNYVRFNFPVLNNVFYSRQNYRQNGYEQGLYNEFLDASDYVHLFTQNLVIISIAGMMILTVWIFTSIKDYYVNKEHKFSGWKLFQVRHEPIVSNFALRFFYEFFFEFCLCVIINIAIRDFSNFTSGIQWLISLCVATSIVLYVGWLISLFFYNGPFLNSFYKEGTWLGSNWGARPFNTEFQAQKKLKLLKFKQKREQKRDFKRSQTMLADKLQLTTQKVTPIDFEGLYNTERPFMNKDRNTSFKNSEPDSVSSINGHVKDKDFEDSDGSDGNQSQRMYTNNHEFVTTDNILLSSQIPLRGSMTRVSSLPLNQKPMIPNVPLDHLTRNFDINMMDTDRPHDLKGSILLQEPMFEDNHNYDDKKMKKKHSENKSQQQVLGEILDFDQSSDSINPRCDLEVSLDYAAAQNVQVRKIPSRTTNQQDSISPRQKLEKKFSQQITAPVNVNQDDKTPYQPTPRDFTPLRVMKQPGYDHQQSIKLQKDFLEEHSLTLNQYPRRVVLRNESLAQLDASKNDQNSDGRQSLFLSPQGLNKQNRQNQQQEQKPSPKYSGHTSGQMQYLYEGGSIEVAPKPLPRQLQRQTSNQTGSKTSTDVYSRQFSLSRKNSLMKRRKQQQIIDPNLRYFKRQKTTEDFKRRQFVQEKQEHEYVIMMSAREMIAGAELIEKKQRFKTLYYGLKLNHPRHVALIHPFLFTLRRIVYALSIVFLATKPLFGIWILLFGTIVMLAFAFTENPWREPIINHQNVFNEIITYSVCMLLLLFNGFVDTRTRYGLGYCLIGTISIFIVYNGIIMMRKVTRLWWLLLLKWKKLRHQRALKTEAYETKKKIQIHLDEISVQKYAEALPSSDEEFEQSEALKFAPKIFKLKMIHAPTGGFRLDIGQDQKAIEQIQQLYDNDSQDNSKQNFQWQLSLIKEVEESEKEQIEDDESGSSSSDNKKIDHEKSPKSNSKSHSEQQINTHANLIINDREDSERPQSQQVPSHENSMNLPLSEKLNFDGEKESQRDVKHCNSEITPRISKLNELEPQIDEEQGSKRIIEKPLESLQEENAELEVSQSFSNTDDELQDGKLFEKSSANVWFKPEEIPLEGQFITQYTKNIGYKLESMAEQVLSAIHARNLSSEDESLAKSTHKIGNSDKKLQTIEKSFSQKSTYDRPPSTKSSATRMIQAEINNYQKEEKHKEPASLNSTPLIDSEIVTQNADSCQDKNTDDQKPITSINKSEVDEKKSGQEVIKRPQHGGNILIQDDQRLSLPMSDDISELDLTATVPAKVERNVLGNSQFIQVVPENIVSPIRLLSLSDESKFLETSAQLNQDVNRSNEKSKQSLSQLDLSKLIPETPSMEHDLINIQVNTPVRLPIELQSEELSDFLANKEGQQLINKNEILLQDENRHSLTHTRPQVDKLKAHAKKLFGQQNSDEQSSIDDFDQGSLYVIPDTEKRQIRIGNGVLGIQATSDKHRHLEGIKNFGSPFSNSQYEREPHKDKKDFKYSRDNLTNNAADISKNNPVKHQKELQHDMPPSQMQQSIDVITFESQDQKGVGVRKRDDELEKIMRNMQKQDEDLQSTNHYRDYNTNMSAEITMRTQHGTAQNVMLKSPNGTIKVDILSEQSNEESPSVQIFPIYDIHGVEMQKPTLPCHDSRRNNQDIFNKSDTLNDLGVNDQSSSLNHLLPIHKMQREQYSQLSQRIVGSQNSFQRALSLKPLQLSKGVSLPKKTLGRQSTMTNVNDKKDQMPVIPPETDTSKMNFPMNQIRNDNETYIQNCSIGSDQTRNAVAGLMNNSKQSSFINAKFPMVKSPSVSGSEMKGYLLSPVQRQSQVMSALELQRVRNYNSTTDRKVHQNTSEISGGFGKAITQFKAKKLDTIESKVSLGSRTIQQRESSLEKQMKVSENSLSRGASLQFSPRDGGFSTGLRNSKGNNLSKTNILACRDSIGARAGKFIMDSGKRPLRAISKEDTMLKNYSVPGAGFESTRTIPKQYKF